MENRSTEEITKLEEIGWATCTRGRSSSRNRTKIVIYRLFWNIKFVNCFFGAFRDVQHLLVPIQN